MTPSSCRAFDNMAASYRLWLRRVFGILSTVRGHQVSIAQVTKQHRCKYCHNVPTENQAWKLMSGVCVERYPVISQQLSSFEKDFKNVCDAIEFEGSVLSEHEIQVMKDRERMKKRKSGELDEDLTGDDSDVVTALDVEDLATEMLNQFETAPRETEADQKNDFKSLNRKLDDKLVLLVKEKLGDDSVWMLPQGYRESGESMKEVAERVLKLCSEEDSMKVKILGNAPVGVYKYKYPKAVQKELGVQGAKVFFYKAKLMQGEFKMRTDASIEDFKWLTREELDSHLLKGYSDCLRKFIFPVSW